jgi:hypothetical protein
MTWAVIPATTVMTICRVRAKDGSMFSDRLSAIEAGLWLGFNDSNYSFDSRSGPVGRKYPLNLVEY